MIRGGESVKYYLPDPVIEYINQKQLYMDKSDGGQRCDMQYQE